MNLKENRTVLYIGGFELPDKNAAAQRVIANAKILDSLGYRVILIGVDKTNKARKLTLDTGNLFEGFTYYSTKYPTSIFEWLYYLVSIKHIINLENICPSYIIAYNYPAFALERLRKYCAKKTICLLGDCTEWYKPTGNILFKIIKGLDVYWRMRIIHPKLDGLIVISEYLFNFYQTKIKNIILLPPLVDLTMNKWKFTNSFIEEHKITLVYAGSPGGKKDRIDKIITVLSEIKKTAASQFTFNIVGLTKKEFLNLFGNDALPKNIDEFVLFKGRLTHNDALKEISDADYQLFIRDNNITNMAGFPTKYVESISCGTPILTNSSSNIEHYFIHGETGFLLDTSSNTLLKNDLIAAISLNKDSIKEMKYYCKSSGMFDYRGYLNLFEEFLNKITD